MGRKRRAKPIKRFRSHFPHTPSGAPTLEDAICACVRTLIRENQPTICNRSPWDLDGCPISRIFARCGPTKTGEAHRPLSLTVSRRPPSGAPALEDAICACVRTLIRENQPTICNRSQWDLDGCPISRIFARCGPTKTGEAHRPLSLTASRRPPSGAPARLGQLC
jgi:hypothetical protein